MIAIKATRGQGTFAVKELKSPNTNLSGGRSIIKVGYGSVLEVYTLDYRKRLQLPNLGTGLAAAVKRTLFAVSYFFRTVVPLREAQKRARRSKSPLAKAQILIGVGAAMVMVVWFAFTVVAVLEALGAMELPVIPGKAADAVALGATAIMTWLFVKVRPAVRQGAVQVQQILEYVQDEQHAAGIAAMLADAVDHFVEQDSPPKIHFVAYSLGSLVALDFLFPRLSLSPVLDERHKAISSLVTIGCPIDFVRLYEPNYVEDKREARVNDLRWTNVFIAADVLGSNLMNGNDTASLPAEPNSSDYAETERPVAISGVNPIDIAGAQPKSVRYTRETLTYRNIWGRRGFLSHSGYWDEPERENCLHLVMRDILDAPALVLPVRS